MQPLDMQALDPPRRLLMGSGPSNPSTRVLQAMSQAPPPSDTPAYRELSDELEAGIRSVFRTSNACALAVPGASRAGIEAVVSSVVEPNDTVLVGVYGHFGELLCTLATRHGARVVRVEAAWGQAIDPAAICAAIREHRPALVAIVHADTSTGILQPLDDVGRTCRETGALFLVDAVLSVGGCAVETDAWQLDAVVGGMQKCLGGPPGLAPLVFSERVRARRLARRTLPRSAYLDLLELASAEDVSGTMLLGLREALRAIADEGLEARWARHRHASAALRAGLRAMGLELFGDARHSVPMITLVRVPDGVSEPGVREQLLEQYGIEIMAAFGPLRGQVWRIGTLGTNAMLPSVLSVLSALDAVLAGAGVRIARGDGVDAALATFNR